MYYTMRPYDDALRFILKNGERRRNRTGVDTLSVFSLTATYRIDEFFPLVTKRKISYKSAFAELLWMLSGSTNNDDLIKLGCNFWTPWVDVKNPENKEFYERTGFPNGYLGPVYGWQMRHFGGNYREWLAASHEKENLGMRVTEDEEMDLGFDQIKWLVNEIKTNPHSRRLIVSLWNPKDMHMMRLPPCHYAHHVDIDNEGRMSLLLSQRSCDCPTGVIFNICFYSALCHMLAQQTGYKPYKFIHHMEDSHIYVNQIEQVEEYLSRPETDSPRLSLNKARDIFSYQVEDFEIVDYNPQPAIKIPVAV